MLSTRDLPRTIVDVLVASDRVLDSDPELVDAVVATYYQRVLAQQRDSDGLLDQVVRQSDLDRAEADFRQSIANRSNGYAAMRLHEYLGDTNPCVAAFGIQHWMDYGSGAGDKAKRARTRRYLEGECAQLEGRGRVAIAIDDERAVPTEEVTVGATTGAFLLDERAAYVVLSEAFAQRAGIEAHAPVDPVLVLGGLLPASTGVAGTVKLGKATADHVAVAVVPELPGGIDGVVGQSFLWRFAIDTTPKGWTIRARR